MPLGNWNSAVDGVDYDRDPSENPLINPGIEFGRLLHLFGSIFSTPSVSTSGGPDKVATFGVKTELLTIAASANSNTVDTTILPANSLILAVTARVTVAIPTATTFTIGDATQASRFATGVAVAVNTQAVGFLHWNPAVASDNLGPRQTANAGIRVTPNSTPGNANGRVRLYVAYLAFAAPSG